MAQAVPVGVNPGTSLGYTLRSGAVVLATIIGAGLSIYYIKAKNPVLENVFYGVSAAALLTIAYITVTHDLL